MSANHSEFNQPTPGATRFVSRYFVGQEPNGDPLVDQVLWEQDGHADPVPIMVRGQVAPADWRAATADLTADLTAKAGSAASDNE